MKRHQQSSRKLVLARQQGLGEIQVDLEAFFELSFSLAEELVELTDRMLRRFPAARRGAAVRHRATKDG